MDMETCGWTMHFRKWCNMSFKHLEGMWTKGKQFWRKIGTHMHVRFAVSFFGVHYCTQLKINMTVDNLDADTCWCLSQIISVSIHRMFQNVKKCETMWEQKRTHCGNKKCVLKTRLGKKTQMWTNVKHCAPNRPFWSSNLCSYIGLVFFASVQK